MTLQDQADYLRILHNRTFALSDGAEAAETYMLVTRDDADVLDAIATRLARMAPFEAQVRELVTGRSE